MRHVFLPALDNDPKKIASALPDFALSNAIESLLYVLSMIHTIEDLAEEIQYALTPTEKCNISERLFHLRVRSGNTPFYAWYRETTGNYKVGIELLMACSEEYFSRFKKKHTRIAMMRMDLLQPHHAIAEGDVQPYPTQNDARYQEPTLTEGYRAMLVGSLRFISWTSPAVMPEWWSQYQR